MTRGLTMGQLADLKTQATQRRRARRSALQELAAIYRAADAAYLPYSCPGTAECCQLATTQREPWLWPVEWEALLAAKGGQVPPPRPDGGCPFLSADGHRCTAYAARPFGCRTFYCSRVQGPPREPTLRVAALLARLARVAQALDEDCPGPRPLLEWAQKAQAHAAAQPPPQGAP